MTRSALLRTTVLLALVVALAYACATLGSNSATPHRPFAVFTIENQNWNYVAVYVLIDEGNPYRIASLETGQTELFDLTTDPGNTCQLQVRPLGGDPWTSWEFPCTPGDSISVKIQNQLPQTTIIPHEE